MTHLNRELFNLTEKVISYSSFAKKKEKKEKITAYLKHLFLFITCSHLSIAQFEAVVVVSVPRVISH